MRFSSKTLAIAVTGALLLSGLAGPAAPLARAADTVFTMQTSLALAPAGITVNDYGDLGLSRAAFAAAAGAHSLIDFNGVETGADMFVYYETGFTTQGVTFTPLRGELYVTDPAYYGGDHYGEGRFLELDSGAPNQLLISFAPTPAFAFEFQYLSYPIHPDGYGFQVTLSDGDSFRLTTLNSFSAQSGLSFFGVVSDQAFSSVLLDLPDFGAYNITDNYRIGAVPEPAGRALLFAGFAGLGAAVRRRGRLAGNSA
jgi:hypothetical protein